MTYGAHWANVNINMQNRIIAHDRVCNRVAPSAALSFPGWISSLTCFFIGIRLLVSSWIKLVIVWLTSQHVLKTSLSTINWYDQLVTSLNQTFQPIQCSRFNQLQIKTRNLAQIPQKRHPITLAQTCALSIEPNRPLASTQRTLWACCLAGRELGHSLLEKGITDKSVFPRLSVALEMLSGISNRNLSQVKPGLHT